MITTFACIAAIGTQNGLYRPAIIVSKREPTYAERDSMRAVLTKKPSQEGIAFLKDHDWEKIDARNFSIFVDLNASNYGCKLKKLRFHKAVSEYFEKYPKSEGYASPELSEVLRVAFSQQCSTPLDIIPHRLSLGKTIQINYILSSNHKQVSGFVARGQQGLAFPKLRTRETFLRQKDYYLPTSELPRREADMFTQLETYDEPGNHYDLIKKTASILDQATLKVDTEDSKVKRRLIDQTCQADTFFRNLEMIHLPRRYKSIPLMARALIDDNIVIHENKTITPTFLDNALYIPKSIELDLLIHFSDATSSGTLTLSETLFIYNSK